MISIRPGLHTLIGHGSRRATRDAEAAGEAAQLGQGLPPPPAAARRSPSRIRICCRCWAWARAAGASTSPAATGGRTLADRLAGPAGRGRNPAPRRGGRRARAAGSQGLLHRDLAPENILLVGYEPRALPRPTSESRFRAPAVLRPVRGRRGRGLPLAGGAAGEPLERRAACTRSPILVECLTGAPPYPYDRPLLTLHAHLVDAPPRVSERVPELRGSSTT